MNHTSLHIAVGVITVLIFLGSGIYMKMHFPDLYASNEIIRYQYRANHVYILMSGLINLMAGLNVQPNYTGWRILIARGSTTLLLIAPLILTAAFLLEPIQGAPEKPVTFLGVLFLLAGVLLAYIPAVRFRQHIG